MTDSRAPLIQRAVTSIGALAARVASRFRALPVALKGVVAGSAVLVIAGGIVIPVLVFASTPAPSHTPSAATPTPRPSAAAHEEPLAGGPCQTMLDPARLAVVLGGSANSGVERGDVELAIVGGSDCRYTFGQDGYVDMTVAPANITSADVLEASLKPTQCSESTLGTYLYECESIVVDGDWWYRVSIGSRTSRDELRASFTTITNELEEALTAAPESPPQVVVRPFDCASAGIEMPLLETDRGHYEGGHGDNELRLAASLLAAPVTCRFGSPEGDGWVFTVYPGGASAYESCAGEPGLSISVQGTTAAFARPVEGQPELCTTDGTSTVVVKRSSATGTGYIAFGANDPALDVLTTLLVPIFQAIDPSTSPYMGRSTSASAPTRVDPLLDGDCSALLDPKKLGGFVDHDHYTDVRKSEPEFEAVGGINCGYDFLTDAKNSGYFPYLSIYVDAVPTAIADPAVVHASLSYVACSSWTEPSGTVHSRCNAIASVHGWWYQIQVFALQTEKDLRADFATLTSMLESSLSAAAPPARIKAMLPFDCGAATGEVSWTSSRATSAGSSAIAVAAALLAGPTRCEYVLPDQHWAVTVYPGMPGALDACTGSRMRGEVLAAPIAISGVKSVVPIGGGGDTVFCATDGASTVRAHGYSFGEVEQISDEATRATLSQLLVPIFAAAG